MFGRGRKTKETQTEVEVVDRVQGNRPMSPPRQPTTALGDQVTEKTGTTTHFRRARPGPEAPEHVRWEQCTPSKDSGETQMFTHFVWTDWVPRDTPIVVATSAVLHRGADVSMNTRTPRETFGPGVPDVQRGRRGGDGTTGGRRGGGKRTGGSVVR